MTNHTLRWPAGPTTVFAPLYKRYPYGRRANFDGELFKFIVFGKVYSMDGSVSRESAFITFGLGFDSLRLRGLEFLLLEMII